MKKNKKIIIYFIIPIIIILIVVVYFFFKKSSAIYYTKDNWNYNVTNSNIYISSNLLTEANSNFNILNYDYSNINFTINNFLSDNQISKKNIKYGISCSTNSEYYDCYIDNTINGVTNQTLNKSFECSISGYTEEQCKNDPLATLTYNKVTNNHSLSIKSNATNNVTDITVTINLSMTEPYIANNKLRRTLSVTFDNDRTGVVIKKLASNDFQCEFSVTNYTDTTNVCLSAVNNNVRFKDNNDTQLCTNIDKYSSKVVVIFKKTNGSDCTNKIQYNPPS